MDLLPQMRLRFLRARAGIDSYLTLLLCGFLLDQVPEGIPVEVKFVNRVGRVDTELVDKSG